MDEAAAERALDYVAPVGERDAFIAAALAAVQPFVSRPLPARAGRGT